MLSRFVALSVSLILKVSLLQIRFTGQVAPVDVNLLPRVEIIKDQTQFGAAFEYDGGSSDRENMPRIVFVDLIFDRTCSSSLCVFRKKSWTSSASCCADNSAGGLGSAVNIDGVRNCSFINHRLCLFSSGF